MEVRIGHRPSYALATVYLAPYEQVQVEPGSMVSFSDGISVETKMQGGILGGLKRMIGGENFFQNTYRAPQQGGEMTLAPSLPGDMMELLIQPGQQFLLQSGAYVATEMGVTVEAGWGGARGFFGGPGLILLRVSGQGKTLISVYGAIEERILAPGQRYTVDTGHIVGMDASIQFNVRGMGNFKSTLLSGEGLVCELTGPGRVLMQTRSEEAFVKWLIPKLPSNNKSS